MGAYGTYAHSDAILTIANGFTNEGTLRLWGDNTGSVVGNATIVVSNGNLINNKKILSGGSESYGVTNSLKAELINNDSTIIAAREFIVDKTNAHHVTNGFIHAVRSGWNNREFTLIQSGTNPSFENFGTFKIDSTNILRLSQGSFINQPFGIITGIGSINSQNGTLNNKGYLLPGDNIGTFSVTGNYPEEPTSVLQMEIGGYSAGAEHDKFNISGNASLSGILNIKLVNGFTPALGDSFLVLTYGSRTGSFSSIVDSSLVSGAEWAAIYNSNSLYIKLTDDPTIIEDDEEKNLPTEFALNQNYPNPFNSTTTIKYNLPINVHVTLSLYDVLGREVLTLVDEQSKAGYHYAILDASRFSSGVYFYRIQVGQFSQAKKFILLR